MLAGLLALVTTIGVVTTPVAPLRYKIELKSSQEVDLSGMGMAKQVGDVAMVAFVSITMSDSGAGRLAHVVIDSMTVNPTGAMAQQGFDAALGPSAKSGFYHLYVVNGKVQGTPKPSIEGNVALASLGQVMTALFPGTIKAALKTGDTYTDTATVTNTTEQGTNNSTTITNWTVKGADGAAMIYEGTSTGKMSVDGGQNAMTGTTTGTRSMSSTATGPVKRATLSTNVDIAVVPAGMSDVIPVKGVSSVTITQLD